jgi:putative CocE/NonD family hydrolase
MRVALAPIVCGLLLGLAACQVERPIGEGASSIRGAAVSWATFPNVIIEQNVPVPMRDGVVLRADLYRPNEGERFPTLVYRTPYGKDRRHENWERSLGRALRSGYAVVVQDVRGRYHSDGRYQAYHQEGKDGYDTIEWAAGQSWSNGRVGTFGLSYPGAVQWLAAMETPPHLAAIFPAMTFASGRHFFYFGGAFNHTWIRWIEVNIAPDERRRRDLPGPRTYRDSRKRWDEHKWEWEEFLPIVDFPLLKDIAPWYYDWLRHPDDGDYWSFADVTAAHDRMTVPALNFSAWYDDNYGPMGAIANFNGMRERAATEEARRGQKLILGPWTHGGADETETRFGELDFGVNATFDYFGVLLRWHDRWLKGIRNGVDDWPPVQIFVMGENVWRGEQEWPLDRTRYVPYYLRGDGSANTVEGDGRLSTEPAPDGEPPDRFTYNPRHPVVIENFESAGPFDHSVIQQRDDVLVYTTDPLDSDVEVTGPITAHLWIASSAVDTDFGLMLLDVHPDGKAFNMMPMDAGFLRARYRDSEESPVFLTPGEPTEIVISGMVTSNLFRAGHRIRILVSSSRFPVFDRNLNTGEPPAASSHMISAHQTILHDAAHPSRVILPVIPRAGRSDD